MAIGGKTIALACLHNQEAHKRCKAPAITYANNYCNDVFKST